jgi:uncharacterized protein
MRKPIGRVVFGSLSEGITLKIENSTDESTLTIGSFITIHTPTTIFFSLLSDLRSSITHPDVGIFPPLPDEKLLIQSFFTRTALVRPVLSLDATTHTIKPVRSLPNHCAVAYKASSEEIALVFGKEESTERFFTIGTPLDDTEKTPICLDLERFMERSSAIFGRTGTGKTFLARLLLAGIIQKNHGVVLIFDTHGEYGIQARREGGAFFVKGLKTLFGNRVALFSLDPASTRRRGGSPDMPLCMSITSITPEAAQLLVARYKDRWLATLLARGDQIRELAAEIGAHAESLGALFRKLRGIERLPFIISDTGGDTVDSMLTFLERGTSIIVEFGAHASTFTYLLVANIITRRLHARYIEKTERYLGSHNPAEKPHQLLIVIEEAHKFLSPQAARQTIFGTIAREMRKYYVSLLVIDQRPSGIDEEIMSQIGTKLCAHLSDERDIASVLAGTPQGNQLRAVLSSLDARRQALVIGYAVAMPVVIETRAYDEAFYSSVGQAQPLKSTPVISALYE